jgi:NAD(P)-dependent dehydrogenase (short-subunit alcohol dehydrogenase family)
LTVAPEQRALIFGGSGGIGSALARRLSRSGWKIALAARDAARLASVAEEIGAVAIAADATRSSDVDAAVSQSAAALGGLNVVVNCVGSILLKPAHLTSDAEWDETVAANLTSAFYIVRAGAKILRRGGGSIALCSSAAAQIGLANHEAISAAKAGIIGLVRSAAATYAPAGVRVNCVAPGLVDTPMAKRITSNKASLDVTLAMHPLGRIGRPEDVASALAWLVDPEQSWVSGQVIGAEGGLASMKGMGG